MSENDLIKAVLRHALKSMKPPVNKDGSEAVCFQYIYHDLMHYLDGSLTGSAKEVFERHAEHCDVCLYGLVRVKEERENERLFDHAMDVMEKSKPRPRFSDIIHVVANWAGKLAWMTDVPSEMIGQPAWAFTTRSGQRIKGSTDSEILLTSAKQVVREFEKHSMSVEAEIDTIDDGVAFVLNLSFYDTQKEEFVAGLDAELVGPGKPRHVKSDENGIVSFILQEEGDYDVFVLRNDEPLLHFNLDLNKTK